MERKLSLYATQKLVELLSNIDHQIANNLNESIRYRNSFPVSYLDFGSTNDTVSFITRNKFDDIQKQNQSDWNSLVWTEKRGEMKIGKLIKMFYQDAFPINHPKDKPRPKPMADIESFVNMFKAERDKDVNYERFEIVDGKDFHYWYTQENYSRFVHEETTLGRSCLRYKESSKFLHMYSKNPDTFRMLILKDDKGKLRARANLWNLETPENRIYMDRVYYVNDSDVELFKNFAKEKGWLHKEQQTYGWHNSIVDTRNGEIYNWDKLVMTAKIKKAPGTIYKYYPYFDTLSIFNTETKTLTNDGRLRVLDPHILLTDYQGSYHSEVDGHERVFSTSYNEYIRRDDAQFVEIDDTWVYETDAVYVHNSGGLNAYRNSDKIVESYIYKKKYFLKEAAEFSEYLGTYIHKESVRIAYLDENKSEELKIHFRMVGKEFIEKDGVIIKKKISPKQRLSSKQYHKKNSLKQALWDLQDGSPSSRRRSGLGSSYELYDRIFEPNPSPEQPEQVEQPSDDDNSESGEENSNIYNVDLSQYNDEERNEILASLESQRLNRRRNEERNEEDRRRNEIRFMPPTQVQQGRPVREEPSPEIPDDMTISGETVIGSNGTFSVDYDNNSINWVEVNQDGSYTEREETEREETEREETVSDEVSNDISEEDFNEVDHVSGDVDVPETLFDRVRQTEVDMWGSTRASRGRTQNFIDIEYLRRMYMEVGIPPHMFGTDDDGTDDGTDNTQ